MKHFVFAIAMLACGSAFAFTRTSAEILATSHKAKVVLISLGGHSAWCMQATVSNLTSDTQLVWFEAGRRLVAADSTEQDIFLVKDIQLLLLPKQTGLSKLFGFCCQSHDHSPKTKGKFSLGFMAPENWVRLARFIAGNNFDDGAVQQAVWAVSNNHSTSSIDRGAKGKNLKLIETVAEIKKEEMPWYNLQYEQSSQEVFTNRPQKITGELNYTLKNNAAISIVVKDWNDMLLATVLEESPAHAGEQSYFMDVDIRNWKDGKYKILVLADGSNLVMTKTFRISTGQVLRE